MPRICTVCTHEDHEMIDRLIVDGFPNRRIAAQFGLSEQSVRRHKKNHFPATLQASKHIEEITHSSSLIARIERIESMTLSLAEELRERGDLRGAVSSMGELRRIAELLAKTKGSLLEKQAYDLHQDPAWSEIRAAIISALRDYPEASKEVIAALEGIVNDQQ
jgi:hypothetical protein